MVFFPSWAAAAAASALTKFKKSGSKMENVNPNTADNGDHGKKFKNLESKIEMLQVRNELLRENGNVSFKKMLCIFLSPVQIIDPSPAMQAT